MSSRRHCFDIIASGLGFPEGPMALPDGSILVCDIQGGVINRVILGQVSTLVDLGGGPNGIALSPDGALYVANNGGAMRWRQEAGRLISEGFLQTGYRSRVERVCMQSGKVDVVLDEVDGHALEAIDDLVFGADGGFWFSDLGRDGPRGRTYGGIYWSSLNGDERRAVAYPLVTGANGIGLSPSGETLYATEYGAGRLWAWDVVGPGKVNKAANPTHGGRLLWQAANAHLLDSLAVTAAGNIVIAVQPLGAFCVISPDGVLLDTFEMPEHFPTNICFDPKRPNVAYATLSSTGCLAQIAWDEPGLIPQNLMAVQSAHEKND